MINVKEKWVKASKWFNLEEEDRDIIKSLGVFPINDAFEPLWIPDYDILIARGGRGGGKSEHFSQKLITDCRNQDYFKCYYGRKVFDTVRGSCFETLIHNLEELRIHKEFNFSVAQSSSMKIIDKETGNSFHPFGSDKADKLKSIKDPTHMWCEEFDQFTEADFKELLPTLRTERGKNEFLATLNTHNVFPDHWLMKVFFPELYQGDDKQEFDILEGIRVKHLFVNYTDNYFIDQDAYYRKLKLASGGNTMLLNAIANGEWGAVENNAPWLYAFDTNKHVRNVRFMPSFPIYVFIDVNNDPLECSIWQVSPNKGEKNSFIHCIDEFSGKFKVMELGQQIKARYPNSIIYLGGDRSGQNEDVGRNQTVYQILGGAMGLSEKQYLLNTHNLEHADSRILCNAMIHNYSNFYISGENCPNLIRQCQIAKVDNKSAIPSKLLKDRGMYKMDCFDSMRYAMQTLFNDFAKNTYFKAKKK